MAGKRGSSTRSICSSAVDRLAASVEAREAFDLEVCVIGTGYVGLVTGTCLAYLGRSVICVDIDERKIEMLRGGTSPIYEPGLDALIASGIDRGNLSFSTDLKS